MDKIKEFSNSNKINSDDQMSIIDILPNTISWSYKGKIYKIENEDKVIAVLLENNNQIAVIEAPSNKTHNKAYIVDNTGQVIMNIYEIFLRKNNSKYCGKFIIFTDVYYIKDELYFFLVLNNTDFRLRIDTINLQIGDLIESR